MDCSPPRLLCLWGFSRQDYCSRLPCSPPADLPNPGIAQISHIAGRFFTGWTVGICLQSLWGGAPPPPFDCQEAFLHMCRQGQLPWPRECSSYLFTSVELSFSLECLFTPLDKHQLFGPGAHRSPIPDRYLCSLCLNLRAVNSSLYSFASSTVSKFACWVDRHLLPCNFSPLVQVLF